MNGILNWSDAVSYFGDDLATHRKPLATAAWSTHALLACRFVANDTAHVMNGDGEHAEEKLIRSALWNQDLDQALASWDPRGQPMLVLMALNRSPCGNCAHLLARALHRLNDKYPLTVGKQHFVLASRGYYHSNKDEVRAKGSPPKSFTTDRGMRAMKDAGWKLCTLAFDAELPRRGKEWTNYLRSMQ